VIAKPFTMAGSLPRAWAAWVLAVVMLVLAPVLAPLPAFAAGSPQDFVDRTSSAFDAIRAKGTLSAQRAGCRSLVAKVFSLTALSRHVAGDNWRKLDPASMDALTSAVAFRLSEECAAVLRKSKTSGASVRKTRQTNAVLKVTALYPGPDDDNRVFVWSLTPGGPMGYRAVDLSIDGRSVVLTLRADFDAGLAARDGGIKAAIAAVRRGKRR